MASGEDWAYMDTLRPPVYLCLRRKVESIGEHYQPMQLDGRSVDKEDWAHVPWSDQFMDIEGLEHKSTSFPCTRFKMMYDDNTLYVGAELIEPKIWGTLTQKNSALYHENNFEVFLNPDGSRHHYYEVEVNCLNTIWEVLLHRPYKDGNSIENPFNLVSLRSAVFVDGVTNSPETECVRWCIEMSWSLSELQQFNKLRFRANAEAFRNGESQLPPMSMASPRPPSGPGETPRPAVTTSQTVAGDVWRVNFLRVQYHLETVMNEDTNQLQYQKIPDKREENIAWAPTGVIDIHRPEKWGFVFFSSETELPGGEMELAGAMNGFLKERMAIERVLNAVYYHQRVFYASYGGYASTMKSLYSKRSSKIDKYEWMEAFPLHELLQRYELSFPVLSCCRDLVEKDPITGLKDTVIQKTGDRSASVVTGRKSSRHYAPALDQNDEHFAATATEIVKTIVPPPPPALSPRSREIQSLEARGLYSNYVVTVRSATQEWHMRQDARLWRTA